MAYLGQSVKLAYHRVNIANNLESGSSSVDYQVTIFNGALFAQRVFHYFLLSI